MKNFLVRTRAGYIASPERKAQPASSQEKRPMRSSPAAGPARRSITTGATCVRGGRPPGFGILPGGVPGVRSFIKAREARNFARELRLKDVGPSADALERRGRPGPAPARWWRCRPSRYPAHRCFGNGRRRGGRRRPQTGGRPHTREPRFPGNRAMWGSPGTETRSSGLCARSNADDTITLEHSSGSLSLPRGVHEGGSAGGRSGAVPDGPRQL